MHPACQDYFQVLAPWSWTLALPERLIDPVKCELDAMTCALPLRFTVPTVQFDTVTLALPDRVSCEISQLVRVTLQLPLARTSSART